MDDRTPRDGAGPEGRPSPASDEAFDRLCAADPAAGAHPDTGLLRARLAAAGVPLASSASREPGAAEPEAVGTTGETGQETAAVHVLGARRHPSRWLQVAAAVAGVAVVGGGGYLLGTARDGVRDTAAVERDSAVTEGPAAAQAVPDLGGGRVGGTDSSAGASAFAAGPGWGRTVFSAAGLSDEPTTHEVWAYDAASVFSAQTAARLAQALGVEGEPRQEWGSWVVGPTDGSGPSVNLAADGTAGVNYYDPRIDPWTCVRSMPDSPQPDTPQDDGGGASGSAGSTAPGSAAHGSAGQGSAAQGSAVPESESTSAQEAAKLGSLGEDAVVVAPEPGSCKQTGDPAPTGDAAVDRTREVLASLGLDADGYEYEATTDRGSGAITSVTAAQVVAGEQVGASWYVALTAEGVQSLSGPLAPLVSLGTYDVVSPTEAVARLSDPRFGATAGDVRPLALPQAGAAVVDPSAPPTVPTPPAAGSPLAWPVQDVTITSARLVVRQTYLGQGNGSVVLAPTYELSDADGSTWTVLAVADAGLDFSPVD